MMKQDLKPIIDNLIWKKREKLITAKELRRKT